MTAITQGVYTLEQQGTGSTTITTDTEERMLCAKDIAEIETISQT